MYGIRVNDGVFTFNENGDMESLELAKNTGIVKPVKTCISVDGCETIEQYAPKFNPEGGLILSKRLYNREQDKYCTISEHFYHENNSLRWDFTIESSDEPWTAFIRAHFHYEDCEGAGFWTAWANGPGHGEKGQMSGDEKTCAFESPWNDPLKPGPLEDGTWYYGAPYYMEEYQRVAYCPFYDDITTIPLAVILDRDGFGISIVQSLEDVILDAALDTRVDGRITYTRIHHRLGGGNKLKFSANIVVHPGDWRGGLWWAANRYPKFFEPVNNLAYEVSGCGAYSTHEAEFDTEKMNNMAFKVNWKASFDFPYMGMFIPPVDEDYTWTDFRGEKASIQRLREYSHDMKKLGYCCLNYFNVTEFGANVKYPFPTLQTSEDEHWKNCNDYLSLYLKEAVVLSPKDAPNPQMPDFKAQKGMPYWSWCGCVAMDPGEECYKNFLVEQARKHVEYFPDSFGVCIDRMDWLRLYNNGKDDGVSFVNGKVQRSLYMSWRDIMKELSEVFHENNKVIYCNNHVKRIDLLDKIDGIFDEFSYGGTALNTTALLCVRKPAIGWVGGKEQISRDPDGFMQKYIYMGVHPMAPFPGNDHSLGPDDDMDRLYLDYGPMLNLLRGRKWVLTPDCIKSEGGLANIFEIEDGYIVPVVYGGENTKAHVHISNIPGLKGKNFSVIHPGLAGEAVISGASQNEDSVDLDVPLFRGCAMIYVGK